MKKRIVIVVDSIDVNDSSGSKANVALIRNLASIGYKVKLFHFTQKNIHIKDIECIAVEEKKYSLMYFLSRSQRVIQRYFKVNLAKHLEPLFGFSFTFFNDVNSIVAELKKLNISEFDLILTLSKGASFRPHYAINKMPNLHGKWMAYIHDPYPFTKYPEPYNWNDPGHIIKERFFKEVADHAKYSAFPSFLLKEWMGSHFENFNKTGIVIPHQTVIFKTETPEIPDYFDVSKFNLLHAGNLMKQRSPKGLIEGFGMFLERNPWAKKDARLLLIGSASYHKKMLDDAQKRIPLLFVYGSNRSFSEIQYLQHNVSVNIILEAKSETSPFLPGKFPHCVHANKPIMHLGPRLSETRRLLDVDYPYVSEANDAETISKVMNQLYNDWLKSDRALGLNRDDLEIYLGKDYLKKQMETVLGHD